MGKTTDLPNIQNGIQNDIQKVKHSHRPVEQRIKDYRECVSPLPEEAIMKQAERCMDCGVPFCHSLGCPVNNLIPELNDLVKRSKWEEAYHRLELTNNFPEITGRVCPALCEASCVLSINSNPVAIRNIELAIIEHAFEHGYVQPKKPAVETGKRIAIIGSGPAGLTAAQQLRRSGHSVVVFEKAKKSGGILRYGIPDFKLEKWVIDRRLDQLEKEGVEFETDVVIGEDISARYLKKTFDSIVLTLGAGKPRNLDVPGRKLAGIHFAMDYLTGSNAYVSGELANKEIISALNKNVLIIGGGDTGSDCLGTAIRQGAKKVHQFEIMPMPQKWNKPHNPSWPDWPLLLRTSSSHEEGGKRDWAILTRSFSGDSGNVSQGLFTRVDWSRQNKNGNYKMEEIPNSEFTLDIDMVLLSMGFEHVDHKKLINDLEIGLDEMGNISIDKNYMTSEPGIFAAGDASTGPSLVVRAIYHGRETAGAVDKYLKLES